MSGPKIGQRIEFKNWSDKEWRTGEVVNLDPLKVLADDTDNVNSVATARWRDSDADSSS